jgi:hypothetical protein
MSTENSQSTVKVETPTEKPVTVKVETPTEKPVSPSAEIAKATAERLTQALDPTLETLSDPAIPRTTT